MSLLTHLRDLLRPSPSPALTQAPGPAGLALDALRRVIDPEMGLDIVNLGLIRQIEGEGDRITVTMTLTTAGCPMAGHLQAAVEEALFTAGWPEVDLVWTFDPPWEPAHITDAGRARLEG